MKFLLLLAAIFVLVIIPLSSAELSATVCCEKTTTGAFCQNVPAEQCASDARQVPTSCDSTSYCKLGTCYDSNEGTCLDNTPQLVCNSNGGVWSEESPAQCNLGCCILGDQAAFVSLVRCKKLSSFLGLQTNYDKTIPNEVACVQAVQKQDKGACVYEFEFEKTCKFTTRAECDGSLESLNGSATQGTFYKDLLCSAEELGTKCGPSTKTSCMPGKDEVYFLDTCGNPANVYDASKTTNKEYWTFVKSKTESCNPDGSNAESAACGNCNYLEGSYCRSSSSAGARATYGDNICADLNCRDENGEAKRHGGSWCASDAATTGVSKVGSEFFRRICMNGEVVTEACDGLRAQECVQDSIETASGSFSQAACRVNRWQDCLAQTEQKDCQNDDRRDCSWRPGVTLLNDTVSGLCLPRIAPGLDFWNDGESKTVCGIGSKVCVVQYEKGLFGGSPKCVDNCECLTPGWEESYGAVCSALGDCGAKVNYVGKVGFRNSSEALTITSG